ncbi:hypothetical protein O9X98_09800 [Agrobacterium salinitolerans]|nr:hypothetical protein [Agrobacterium salinitolerans]
MRILTLAFLVAAPLSLASCMSSAGHDARYGRGEVESSFTQTGGMPTGKPQYSGWRTTANDREAERRSVARDIPYGVVSPSGTVVIR